MGLSNFSKEEMAAFQGPMGKPKRGKKVVMLAPAENGKEDLFRHLKSRQVVDPNSRFHPAPNMAQIKAKREQDGRAVLLDIYEVNSEGVPGSAPKSFMGMLVDAKGVIFVASNAHPESLERLTLYLATAHSIPGRKFLAIANYVPSEMAALKEETIESWARTKGCNDIIYFDPKTAAGVDSLLQKLATALSLG